MARKPPQPNAENCSLAELEVAARAAPNYAGYDRLTAIRALLLGVPHETAAQLACVRPRTLAGWVHKFNASGMDGLTDKPRPGRPRKIAPALDDQLQDLVAHPVSVDCTH